MNVATARQRERQRTNIPHCMYHQCMFYVVSSDSRSTPDAGACNGQKRANHFQRMGIYIYLYCAIYEDILVINFIIKLYLQIFVSAAACISCSLSVRWHRDHPLLCRVHFTFIVCSLLTVYACTLCNMARLWRKCERNNRYGTLRTLFILCPSILHGAKSYLTIDYVLYMNVVLNGA